MRRAIDRTACALALTLGLGLSGQALAAARCDKPVYLTIDTGHMGVASLVADVLTRHQVKATFFLANERTQAVGARPEGSSLDEHWAAWWKQLAAQGHDFGSHTWDHVVWQADTAEGLRVKPTAGPRNGERQSLSATAYCEQLQRPATRFEQMTGQRMRAIFRAPGGRTSPRLLAVAHACGWQHVPWTPNGFLGDELDSKRYPNAALLGQALQRVRSGEILLMHLGIWSRQDAWAPAVLEPLIVGLKERGFCFETLRQHPTYRAAGPAPHEALAEPR
ncbi:polysaccharide deacetylase family protein [Aquabacterium parvum]|jgi:peptidoglycan/xylan/chitin deacetylase (PgdA/CDA1 family)|uniref:polysaccharide deacetylase family protein n=1 Tax=Aquabacterium parvum TaxID=70584 RepID=UPI0009F91928|nr:polysaccharide deacetylase family protein [Aquabacterium parvum]MBU0916881.1 polysaccharide deacetylase family protein [Gammaproteobacteria bacterium]